MCFRTAGPSTALKCSTSAYYIGWHDLVVCLGRSTVRSYHALHLVTRGSYNYMGIGQLRIERFCKFYYCCDCIMLTVTWTHPVLWHRRSRVFLHRITSSSTQEWVSSCRRLCNRVCVRYKTAAVSKFNSSPPTLNLYR
jgi:hypothetical protein